MITGGLWVQGGARWIYMPRKGCSHTHTYTHTQRAQQPAMGDGTKAQLPLSISRAPLQEASNEMSSWRARVANRNNEPAHGAARRRRVACVRAAPLTPKLPPTEKKHASAPIIAFIVHRFCCFAPYFLFASERPNAPCALFSTPAVLHFSGPANLVAGEHAFEKERTAAGNLGRSTHMLSFIIPGPGWIHGQRRILLLGTFLLLVGDVRPRDYLCNNNEDVEVEKQIK